MKNLYNIYINLLQIINLLKGRDPNISVITILFSGRPMIITDPLKMSDAFIAAWLPGTTGGAALV